MDELPDEVLAIVAVSCSPRELGRLSQVASRFHDAVIRDPEAGLSGGRWWRRGAAVCARSGASQRTDVAGLARTCATVRDSTIVQSVEHAVALAYWLRKHPKLELLYRKRARDRRSRWVNRFRAMHQAEPLSEQSHSKRVLPSP